MSKRWTLVMLGMGTMGALAAGCGDDSNPADTGDAGDAGDADDDADGSDGDGAEAMPETTYDPYRVVPSDDLPDVRGWTVRRGIIHAHSTYSHDGCDDEPFIEGVRNEQCFDDLREGMCSTAQDFVFLTDHASLFADHEYPDVLLYKTGDTLIERGGLPVANRVDCGDGRSVIVGAGTETGTMPIGLEHHVGATPDERHAAYDDDTPAGVEAFKAAGAVAFVYHTEEWDVATLESLPLDGIEIYNTHANIMQNLGVIANLVIDMQTRPHLTPAVEIGLVAAFEENEPDLLAWSRLAAIRKTVGILATDVHRNSFDGETPDGERLDSYRRMMHWFSNYVLIAAGDYDDATIKEAIRSGRLYGGFDYLGYAYGFDFRAESDSHVYEMGETAPMTSAVVLHVAMPTLTGLDPAFPPPTLRSRILRANDGAWDEVASGDGDLEFTVVEAGVYRAEIRMTPEHLRPLMGWRADTYMTEKPWVYSNPIWVGTEF